jgi:hypothetical protein
MADREGVCFGALCPRPCVPSREASRFQALSLLCMHISPSFEHITKLSRCESLSHILIRPSAKMRACGFAPLQKHTKQNKRKQTTAAATIASLQQLRVLREIRCHVSHVSVRDRMSFIVDILGTNPRPAHTDMRGGHV